MADRINEFRLTTRLFNIEKNHTPDGKTVTNARTNLAYKLDGEWQPVWYQITAWEDVAEELAKFNHGDDVVITGRQQPRGYTKKDGTLVEEPGFVIDTVTRVDGTTAPAKVQSQPAPSPDDEIPF